jgi:ribose 5-phosphate isomerase A
VRRDLEQLGARVELRGSGQPYVTDEGNHILDCHFGPIDDPDALGARLDGIVGAVEHGLFVGFAPKIIVGRSP